MIITITSAERSGVHQEYIRQWCSDNGFLAAQVAGSIRVDIDAQTIRINQLIPLAGQDDADFPEIRVDQNGDPVTEEKSLPLLVSPPPNRLLAPKHRSTSTTI